MLHMPGDMTVEQMDQVLALFLNQFRRPTRRTWERFNGEEWKAVSGFTVKQQLYAIMESVTGRKSRPESDYKKVYSHLAWSTWNRENSLHELAQRQRNRSEPDHNP